MDGAKQGALTLRSLQLLVGGLMTGVVALLVVALLVSPPDATSFTLHETQTIWLGVILAFVTGAAGLVVVLSRLLIGRAAAHVGREDWGEGALIAELALFTIVRSAIVEGVGLLGVTIYLIADLGIGLALTVLSLLGLLVLFPTAARLRAFEEKVTRPQ